MTYGEDRVRKEEVADLYNRVAANYGHIGPDLFAPFGQWLVEQVNPLPGARVLDVATGRGAVLFAAAQYVGSHGTVVGIDLAEQMIQETLVDIHRKDAKNVTVHQMDAEYLSFLDSSFDNVLCGYALFFFPNIERVFAEFYRVLRPGGRLGVSVPYGGDELWYWYGELLDAYHKQYHFSLDQGGPFLASTEIISLLSQTGFDSIETSIQEFEFVYEHAEDWWQSRWTEAGRFLLERIPSGALERFKFDVFKRLEGLKQQNGWHYRRKACCFLATRPILDRT
jgi:O-methyltransferase/aklanonic acid methyltransferase